LLTPRLITPMALLPVPVPVPVPVRPHPRLVHVFLLMEQNGQ